jgi:hypothetical protein
MRAGAGFHADEARRLTLKKLKHLAAPKLTTQQGATLGVNTVQLENRLRQIDPDCGNVTHGWLPSLAVFTAPNMAHCDAGNGSHPLHQWRSLRRIAEIYKVEADIRGCAPGQRLSARQARTAPLFMAFGDWLQEQQLRVSAKSRLGEKLAYVHGHWDGLQTFLDDGRVEIDSNGVENLIRPIALNRKNALFAGHDEGDKAWGRIASLIETAKINGIEPFAYLKATLEAIAAGHPQNRIDDLLPWNFTQSS